MTISNWLVRRSAIAAVLVAAFCTALPARAADQKKKPKGKPLSAAEIYKRSSPAIVAIDCFGPERKQIGTASGFLVSDNGRLLTNLHVIASCASVAVRMANGDTYDTTYVLEVDARKDIALIRFKGASLPYLSLGESNDLEVGQQVYSIGNPVGLQNTLQQGLVSGFRQMNGYRLVQVSASINSGNSGCPILDDRGNVVAIAAAKIQGAENLGFAIPINYAKGYLDSRNEVVFTAFAAMMKTAVAQAAVAKQNPAGTAGVAGGVPAVSPTILGGVMSGVPGGAAPPPPPPPKNEPRPPAGQRVRVGAAVQQAKLIRQPAPEYPPLAKEGRIAGVVKLSAVIGKDGTVQQANLISGHPLLAPAALAAVKQWTYQPTLLNGEAVEVATEIDVNFMLNAASNGSATATGVVATDLPTERLMRPPAAGATPGPALEIGADKLETFLRGRIGDWDITAARTALGEAGVQGPFRAGAFVTYEFPAPGPRYSSVILRFSQATGKLVNLVLIPDQIITWETQEAYMWQKFPNQQPRAVGSGEAKFHSYSGARTNFRIRPDGTIAFIVVY